MPCTMASSHQMGFSLLTHGGNHGSKTTCIHFLKLNKFNYCRKLQVQDSHSYCNTLLKISNLEHCENSHQQAKESARHPQVQKYISEGSSEKVPQKTNRFNCLCYRTICTSPVFFWRNIARKRSDKVVGDRYMLKKGKRGSSSQITSATSRGGAILLYSLAGTSP